MPKKRECVLKENKKVVHMVVKPYLWGDFACIQYDSTCSTSDFFVPASAFCGCIGSRSLASFTKRAY